MTRELIMELAEKVPADALYLGHLPRRPAGWSPRLGRRMMLAVDAEHDAGFGWKFACAFAQLGRPLPLDLDVRELLEAYWFVVGQWQCPELAQAASFMSPNNVTRHLVSASLLIKGLSLEELSQRLAIPVKTLHYFDQLFFNVRDRLDEVPYILSLAYPQGRQSEWTPGYLHREGLGYLMLRVAYRHGFETLAWLAGLASPGLPQMKTAEMVEEIEARILDEAVQMMKIGGAAIFGPDAGLKLLLARRRQRGVSREPEPGRDLCPEVSISYGIDQALRRSPAYNRSKSANMDPGAPPAAGTHV